LPFMRLSYVAVFASLLPAVACATGEEILNKKVQTIDAGPLPEENGGDPGDLGSGGAVGSGGTSSGGVPTGGMQTAGSNSGGKASGGMPGTGGKAGGGASSGGTTSTGGSASGGKAGPGTGGRAPDPGDAGSCPAGQKFCGGNCTPPAPVVGCGTSGCDKCTMVAPANGYITCANNQCVFDCLSGFMKMGNSCVGSGAGGSSGNCNVSSCPNCNVIQGPKCCTAAGKCGCPLIPYVTPTCA
jgi:hypothetical protein